MDNLKEIIKESLQEHLDKSLILKSRAVISESLQYHIDNGITLTNNIFKTYSEGYFDLVNEVRELWEDSLIKLNEEDTLMVESDLGKRIKIGKEIVYLDAPFVLESWTEEEVLEEEKHHGKNVKLDNPFKTSVGPKKFAVYVKSKSGGVKKVSFGDPNLKVKNKGTTKSFRELHKCDQKKDRTTAGYWSCNVGRYSKQLGLSS